MTDFISVFSSEVTKFLSSNDRLIDCAAAGSETINVKTIEGRETFICQLTSIIESLSPAIAHLTDVLSRAKENHTKDLALMGALMNRMKAKKESDDWQPARKGGRARVVKSSMRPSLPPPMPSPAGIIKVKFTEALHLSAIRVPTFDHVKQNGELYYIDTANHFAIKLAGHMFHGNIGVIYTDEKNPEKIKDCKFADLCVKRNNCDYYHDPIHHIGSKDYRNFIASSWLYSQPGGLYKNKPKSRRFGSRQYLDIDIVGLQGEEISRFHDQTMHDILCSLLISKYFDAK
jgi:hypothetical protein